jgi:hypothetical protein
MPTLVAYPGKVKVADQEIYLDNAPNFSAKVAIATELDDDLRAWLSSRGIETLRQAFAELERADWMIRLIAACGVAVEQDQCVGFAADCAEHVLHTWQAAFPDDDEPAQAIAAARLASVESDAAAHDALLAGIRAIHASVPPGDRAGRAAMAAAAAAFAAESERPSEYCLGCAADAADRAQAAGDSLEEERRWQMDCLRRWF